MVYPPQAVRVQVIAMVRQPTIGLKLEFQRKDSLVVKLPKKKEPAATASGAYNPNR
jgi:hypothetical protein